MPLQVPDRLMVKLKYATFQTATSGGVAPVDVLMSGNGLFDPEVGVGGSTPLGYAAYASLYNNYRCFASAIKTTLFSSSTTIPLTTITQWIIPSTDVTPLALGVEWFMSQKYCKYALQNLYKGNPIVKNYMSTQKLWGVNKGTVMDDEIYSADVASLPANQWYWHCCFQQGLQATNFEYQWYVEVIYYAEFFGEATVFAAADQANIQEQRMRQLSLLQKSEEEDVLKDFEGSPSEDTVHLPHLASTPHSVRQVGDTIIKTHVVCGESADLVKKRPKKKPVKSDSNN